MFPNDSAVSRLAGFPSSQISAAFPYSPRNLRTSPLTVHVMLLPDRPIRFSASKPYMISASEMVSFLELNSFTFLSFTVTDRKSFPAYICAVTAIPNGVTASGPYSFLSLNFTPFITSRPRTTTLSSGRPSCSARIFDSSGIRLPPPTRNTALGDLRLYSSILPEIVVASSRIVSSISRRTSAAEISCFFLSISVNRIFPFPEESETFIFSAVAKSTRYC